MQADVFLFLSIYLCLALFLFFSGFSFLKLFKNTFSIDGFYTKSFISLLCGLMLLVTGFAVFKTHLLTVTLFFPFVFLLAFYKKKINLKQIEVVSKIKRGFLFFLSNGLLVLLPFAYFSFIIFKTGSFHFKALEYDNTVYAQLSNYIAGSGQENKWFSYFTDTSSISGIEPYHYVECWLNAFVSSVFKTNGLINFYLVTYPLFILISIFGILALIECFKQVAYIDLAIAFILLFIGAIFHVKNYDYHFNTMSCEIPLQHYGEKFAVYYPFILMVVLFLIKNYRDEALLCSLSLCVVSSTLLPAFLTFSILYTLFGFRKKHKSTLFKLFLFLITMILFYKIFSASENSSVNTNYMMSYSDLNTEVFTLKGFKLALSNFVIALLKSLAYFFANYLYVPLLFLLAVLNNKKENLKSLLVLLTICFCGLLCACFFYKFSENYQLFTNTLPILHITCITILILLLYKEPLKYWTRFFSVVFLVIFSGYSLYFSLTEYSSLNQSMQVSDEYILKAKDLVTVNDNHQKVGFIYNQKDWDTLQLNRTKNYLYHLSYLGLDPVTLRMSILQVKYPFSLESVQKDQDMILKHELFYSFYLKQRNKIQNMDSLQLSFLRSHNINYLVLSPTVETPVFLTPKNSEIISDAKTSIRFVRLRFL